MLPWEATCSVPPLSATRGRACVSRILHQECPSGNPTSPLSGACCLPFGHLCLSFLGPGVGLGWRWGDLWLPSSASEHSPQTLPWPSHTPGCPLLLNNGSHRSNAHWSTGSASTLLASSVHPLIPPSPSTASRPTHLGCG